MEYNPKETFEAAVRLAALPFTSNIYSACTGAITVENLRKQLLRTPEHSPSSGPGTLMTHYGLVLYIVEGFPSWIETPWGEWNCWGNPSFFSPRELLTQFVNILDIYEEDSAPNLLGWLRQGQVDHGRIVLRSVGAIALPPAKSLVAYPHAKKNLNAWRELCASHDPPIPVESLVLA